MSIQDLGSIGELIAAVATIATLAYLAIQMRQNTRALTSSTFQEISNDMSVSSQAVSTNPELSAVVITSYSIHDTKLYDVDTPSNSPYTTAPLAPSPRY